MLAWNQIAGDENPHQACTREFLKYLAEQDRVS